MEPERLDDELVWLNLGDEFRWLSRDSRRRRLEVWDEACDSSANE
jgi:hypothetical protein